VSEKPLKVSDFLWIGPCFVDRPSKRNPLAIGSKGRPAARVAGFRRAHHRSWPWKRRGTTTCLHGLDWWPGIGRKRRRWVRPVARGDGVRCGPYSGEVKGGARQCAMLLAPMGPKQGAGRAKRPTGRAETGACPGGGHGGSAGLAEMARRGRAWAAQGL
jgi:hypothetical protein